MSTNNVLNALEQYRLLYTPVALSWKQHWAKIKLSDSLFFKLTEHEQNENIDRFKESTLTICDNIKQTRGEEKTIWDLINIIRDPGNKNIIKANRKVFYSSGNGRRPIGKDAWLLWNGFQVIDLDIKNRDLANKIKPVIFDKLNKFNWFIGVVFSSSGQGLHVYTKITIPEKNENDINSKKTLYIANFRHKYSFVYLAILSASKILNITKESITKWMDLSMFKPQQGAFIGYDPDPYISAKYFEDFIYVGYESENIKSNIDWLTYPDLAEIFSRWEWFSQDCQKQDPANTAEIIIKNSGDISGIHTKIHYRHNDRWKLANTLVKLYGPQTGYECLRAICADNIPSKELQADCMTATRYAKPLDSWAISLLNKNHGFNIKARINKEETSEANDDTDAIFSAMSEISNPLMVRESNNFMQFTLNCRQYLSDIKNNILSNISKITLLEAGPGLGKTEFIKQLVADGHRILLVMPFISTIQAKTEKDENWEYAYSNKKPALDTPKNGLCVTMDKFSKLNIMDLAIAGFEYIVIDESHLLFQSGFRPVMSSIIDMIARMEIPVILMTGTPSGELSFFPEAAHINVIKDDKRQKEFKVNITNTPKDLLYWIGKSMADEISKGRRVFFPTNRGTRYYVQIVAAVNWFLINEHGRVDRPVKAAYYKKSNLGELFMDNINFQKTIGDLELVCCSQYMSVGVDILDKFDFSIYMSDGGFDLFMPQEIFQFANRLRNNNLIINFFTSRTTGNGETRDIYKYKPLDFKLNENEKKDINSILTICNNSIKRNPNIVKHNPIIYSILQSNEFIKYNPAQNLYYIDDTHYKTIYWERKYREYVQQLPVIMKGMEAYQFTVTSKNYVNIDTVMGAEQFYDINQLIKSAAHNNLQLSGKSIDNILANINDVSISMLRDVLKGKYEIRKGQRWKIDPINFKMTCDDVENFNKIVPFIINFSKTWDMDDIKRIFESCKNANGSYSITALRRIKILNNILNNLKNDNLDLPINDFLTKTYAFVDSNTDQKTDEPVPITRKALNKFIHDYTRMFAVQESTGKIKILNSTLTMEHLTGKFMDLFMSLVTVSQAGKFKIKLKKAQLFAAKNNLDIKNNEEWLSTFMHIKI